MRATISWPGIAALLDAEGAQPIERELLRRPVFGLRRRQARQAVVAGRTRASAMRQSASIGAARRSRCAACAAPPSPPRSSSIPRRRSPRTIAPAARDGRREAAADVQVVAHRRASPCCGTRSAAARRRTPPDRHPAAAATAPVRHRLSSANSAITRPFGVSQPFHCQCPTAQRRHVVHELRLRETRRIAACEREDAMVGKGEIVGPEQVAGCQTWGRDLNFVGCESEDDRPIRSRARAARRPPVPAPATLPRRRP